MRSKEKKEINIIVGENIRKYREIAGYSRERLAELVGVSPRFFADAETGFVGVSLTTLKKTCEVLGVSADKLLWNTDSAPEADEILSHLDEKYLPLVLDLLRKQLAIIALTEKEHAKKTRN